MATYKSLSEVPDQDADELGGPASLETSEFLPKDVILKPLPAAWDKARSRVIILQPLLEEPGNRALMKEVSQQSGVSEATLYRWLKLYKTGNSQAALVDKARGKEGERAVTRSSRSYHSRSYPNALLDFAEKISHSGIA
jgi:hypothetical protein